LITEAYTIGFGTSGGTTAHLNTFMDTPYTAIIKNFNEEYAMLVAKAAKEALELIKRNVEEYKIDCGHKTLSGFLFSQHEKQTKELQDIFEACNKVGLDVHFDVKSPVPVPYDKVLEVKQQACFHPTRYLFTLAEEFEKSGGVLMQDCRVMEVDENDIIEITTSRGPVKARNLIYATHTPPGVNILHFRLAPYRSYAMAFKLKDEKDYPDGLAYDMYDPYHYFRTQEIDGEKFLIVGGEDHKTGHNENTDACFNNLEAYVMNYYDIDRVAFKWSSQYFEPVDGLPYIGQLPGHKENMYVATGYGGNGMTYSAIAALTLCDILVTGESEYQKVFNPNRMKPVAGLSDFVKENADVVSHLIGDVFSREKLEAFVELAPGEGRVVKYEGSSIALYKDDNGKLHAVNPACTHVKCTIAWNASEKTWDCPCHGSRFSFDGEVLTAPAQKELQAINLAELVKK
jgi:glycine/D-amino acid oxidase-like deaminating enzyme/nitrite reductase/ring-hydroxylating ferredoxin subunit